MSNHKMQNKNGFSGAATEDETAMRLHWATSTEDAPRLGVREVQAHSFLLCPLIREVVIVRLRAGGRGCVMPAQIKFGFIHRTIPSLLVSDAHQAVFDLG